MTTDKPAYRLICRGGLANESIFIIILKQCEELLNVINESVNVASWEKMSSANSPFVFKSGIKEEMDYIDGFFKENKYLMFIRKVDVSFPDHVLREKIKG